MSMPHQTVMNCEFLKNAHSEFARLYNTYNWQIRAIWHKLDRNERARLYLDYFNDGPSVRNVENKSEELKLKSVLVPELNLNDVTSSAKFLLNHFKHRATTSLLEQYRVGPDGALGDGPFVIEKLNKKQLTPRENRPNYYFIFTGEWYGELVELKEDKETETLIKGGNCVSYGVGSLMWHRQYTSLMDFRFLVLRMLMKTPRAWWTEEQWESVKQDHLTVVDKMAAMIKETLATRKAPVKTIPFAKLLLVIEKQRNDLEDYLAILRDEPSVLVYQVNSWLLSRPELVTDDRGRNLPPETDKHISCAIFEVVRGWIQKFAITSYMYNLTQMWDDPNTKSDYELIILQEISNVLHFEYSRAQAHLIRHVQTGIGARCFRRVPNAYDEAGNPRVVMRVKPEELNGRDSLLQHILRLCQPQTHASQAFQWVNKLDELYNLKPSCWKSLHQREMDALDELIYIVSLIEELSMVVALPPLSRKTGQMFINGSWELDYCLNKIRKEVDLQAFSVPLNKLLEPGMANEALAQLDDLVVLHAGCKMDFFCHYVVQECLAYHRAQSQETKDIGQNEYPFTAAYCIAEGVDLKKYKENRSPVQTSPSEDEQATNKWNKEQRQKLYANRAAKNVFSTLFEEPKAGASITWSAFISSMVAMGFCVKHGYCSIHVFVPPSNMPTMTILTVSRPLNLKIEGHLILTLARQLKKAYGKFIPFGRVG
ncbi:hypothetical protein THAR02_07591 [Trichoderma harzianum]|uniref:Uncharacterized protein n=1 Tax=Trichoderma harzianum TaxID=5544 RepID=A0A0F9ZIZ8_TRIHA|nr:hypothetical protein THAR02_07591 [Trichoderma harzianum]